MHAVRQYRGWLLAALSAVCVVAAPAQAATVSTTVNLSRFTMGGFYDPFTASFGVTANGVSSVPASGDDAFAHPETVFVPLSGDSVTFGYGPGYGALRDNAFTFAGNTADVAGSGPSNVFKIGTLTFLNGQFNPLAFIDFSITTHSSDAALDNKTFDGRIRLDVNNPMTGDPVQEADYFTIQDSTGSTITTLGSVRVYDYLLCPAGDPTAPACNVGSVDIYGHIDSLHLDYFANPTGGAFINASTGSTPVSAVPEPETVAMMLMGLAALAPAVARRRRAASRPAATA